MNNKPPIVLRGDLMPDPPKQIDPGCGMICPGGSERRTCACRSPKECHLSGEEILAVRLERMEVHERTVQRLERSWKQRLGNWLWRAR